MENKINTVSDERGNDYEKIKTYEDACAYLGVRERDFTGIEKDEVSYAKLKTIAKAINGGWEADFTDRKQDKYYPWFWLYTRKELDEFSDTEQKICVSFGGVAYNGAPYGFLYAYPTGVPSLAYAYIGSRLCFKSKEIAEYVGRQFLDVWRDYILN